MRAVLAVVAWVVLAGSGLAQSSGTTPMVAPVVLPLSYTVATLPDPTQNRAHYAFVTDLGGGADMVLSDGVNWKHIRQGVVTNVPIASTVTVTPLSSPPIMQLTSSTPYVGTAMVSIAATASLYAGYVVHIVIPSTVLSTASGAVGTLGVNVSNLSAASALPLVGGTWEDVQWNGTALVELGRGTL